MGDKIQPTALVFVFLDIYSVGCIIDHISKFVLNQTSRDGNETYCRIAIKVYCHNRKVFPMLI